MANENENLNSLKEEKTTLEEELKTFDSETEKDKISEIQEKINSLNDEIKTFEEDDDEDIGSLKETNKRLYARVKKADSTVP